MAVPFRRTSKTRKRMRRSHQALQVTGLVKCQNCGATIKSHNICPKCGYYGGKAIVIKKTRKSENEEKTPAKESKGKSRK